MWRDMAIGLGAALVVVWLGLLVALMVAKPEKGTLKESLRLLPDLLRLLKDCAADSSLPRGVRVRLALLLAYLAMPFDVVPDFIPVLGYADDVIVVVATLRSLVRRVGLEEVRRHWRGTEPGFAALCRVTGI